MPSLGANIGVVVLGEGVGVSASGLKARLKHRKGDVQAPPVPPINGWPTEVDPVAAWDGAKFRYDEQYTYLLTNHEIVEIEAALRHFKALELDGEEIGRDNFPLPRLSQSLDALAEELHFGRGFFALRGLDSANYSIEDNILLFLGISSYIGEKRGIQDDKGHIFAHIKEAKYMKEGQKERPIQNSNTSSTFHTDLFCDILAMQTRSCPAQGGNHLVSSTAKVYSELLKSRPDLIPVLAAPEWPFDTRGKLTPPSTRPLLYHHNNRLLMNIVRDPLTGIPSIRRSPSLPSLTPRQLEALDAVQALAARHARPLAMRPGDLTFVNNMVVLHSRESFVDAPPDRVRYLVRMWLKNEEMALSLPPELEEGNRRVFGGVVGVEEDWNVVYKPRLKFEIAERLSP